MIDIPTGDYSVKRFGKGEYDSRGIYVRGEDREFEINASIQPVTGNMVKLLPEHRRNADSIVIYSVEELYSSDEKDGRPADIVIYRGRKYEVFSVKDWSMMTDINHYESVAIMQDGQGSRNGS